jgi:hypothetical protein
VSARRLLVAPLLAVVVVTTACTGDDAPEPPNPTATGPTGQPTGPQGPVEFVPGEFVFDFAGVKAALSFDGNTANQSITNRTGGELGPPQVAALLRDGELSPAEVAGAGPLGDGEQVELTVQFQEGVTQGTVGAVQIGFGDDVWSWMTPKSVEG